MRLVAETISHYVQRVNQNFHIADFRDILRCAPDETGNPQLMGDTLAGLVKKLLQENISDPKFQEVFFRTYKSFCTPQQFLVEVVTQFKGLQNETGTVKRKVFNTISAWITQSGADIRENPKVCQVLTQFLNGSWIDAACKPFADGVKNNLEMMLKSKDEKPPIMVRRPCQKPIDLKKDPLALLKFSRKDLAFCLSVQDSELFNAIPVVELLDKKWEKPKLAPNLQACIQRSNALTTWTGVVVRIITSPTTSQKDRNSCMSNLIDLCQELLAMHDMLAFTAIVPPLLMVPAKDLQHNLSQRIHEWEDLVNPLHNYARYREYMLTIDPPIIPVLAVTLKDLTFVSDGNSDFLYGTEHSDRPIINFYKRRKLSEIIGDVVKMQIPISEDSNPITPVLWNACLDVATL